MSLERELGHISAKLENIEDLLLTQNSRVSKLEDKVEKDFVEMLQRALSFVRASEDVKGVGVFVVTGGEIHTDYFGDLDLLAAGSGLIHHKIHREWDDS